MLDRRIHTRDVGLGKTHAGLVELASLAVKANANETEPFIETGFLTPAI